MQTWGFGHGLGLQASTSSLHWLPGKSQQHFDNTHNCTFKIRLTLKMGDLNHARTMPADPGYLTRFDEYFNTDKSILINQK